jgi:hypothetical protein
MAEQNPAGWLQNAGATHTAAQMRTYMGALLAGLSVAGATTRTRGGVHPGVGAQLAVAANGTPNMSVNVGSGTVFIPGSEAAGQGVYFCQNDATINLAIATAPGAGVSRIDLVVAKVIDSFYSGGSNAWSLAVITGTAAASPAAPAAPVNSIILARVSVGSQVTSIGSGAITDVRPYAAALGGIIPCSSSARPSFPYESMAAYDLDTNIPIVYNGTDWVPLGGVAQILNYTAPGSFSTSSNSNVNVTNALVTFTKRFQATRLLVRVGYSGFAGATNTFVTLSVSVAATDYLMVPTFLYNVANQHGAMPPAERFITGVPLGAQTVQLRLRTNGNTFTSDSSDNVTITVEEVV